MQRAQLKLVKFDRPTIYFRKSNRSHLLAKLELILPYAKKPVGETGPLLDSRGFSRISPDPLRQKSFFLAKVIL
jgi:hypothetical protein